MTEPTSNQTATQLIQAHFPEGEVTVTGDGYKYEAIIVDSSFEGLSTLARHKLVYKALADEISSGKLHALSIVTHTPDEAT